ncbi:DUF7533 family protein [Natronococcus jeotgali]|uniref:Uncharacterized protein n=1 Tax=Natronococcus jeotgali DSM 18795 TaxID=1227498 RepID=L9XYI1_9EURY|nr:hypothetical protein [Natronococcus jeotgali]ELY65653.1 hypothetical protein C492_03219 [Natronococcus jeotgali DSM 18795]
MGGVIDTIELAGVLVLALPAALAGLELLLVRGETAVGAVLIGLAIALVIVQRRFTLPSDVPAAAAKRVVGAVRVDGDENDDR